jgi:subtilisin family serine protease
VITVGAVDSLDVVASFSSGGPTSDGRIKPDVVAMGRSVRVPRADTTFGYFTTSGTSFSTPLTAGVVALLLEAHPTWGPFEIREALRETALNHATPDTVRGWGLVQAPVARSWVPSTVSVPAPVATAGLALAVHPNPARPGVGATLTLAAPGAGRVAVDVLDLSGRRLARVFEGEAAGARVVRWDGRDDRGAVARAGVYWVRVAGAQGATRSARLVLLN